jgi:hypothetical protein
MSNGNYTEYLKRQYPQIESVAAFYAEQGAAHPLNWALAECKGQPALASFVFAQALRAEISPAVSLEWAAQVRDGELNVENAQLLQQAAAALAHLRECGIDLARLTPLVRALQTQTVRNIAALLDQGPQITCVPLPTDRTTHWSLYAMDAQDQPQTALAGLCALVEGEI